MASHRSESQPDTPEQFSSQDYAVVSYYLQRQKDDPSFWNTLADELWEGLSSEEYTVRTALHASFFPEAIEDRARSIKAGLLVEYIQRQILTTRNLNAGLDMDVDQRSIPPAETH